MRLACLVLAALTIAACPPRRGRVVYCAPACPVVVVAPVPVVEAKPVKPADPALDFILTRFAEKTARVNSVRAEVSLKQTEAALKREYEYVGVMLCMKPNYAVLCLDNVADEAKIDYAAFICDGKSVYAYSGKDKTITVTKLPEGGLWTDTNPIFSVLAGMKPADATVRFDIAVFKTDEHYVHLDIKPKTEADRRVFQSIRLALHVYSPRTEKIAFMPAKLHILAPNGDTETWTFKNHQADLPGIDEKAFRFVPIKGWKVENLPQLPKP